MSPEGRRRVRIGLAALGGAFAAFGAALWLLRRVFYVVEVEGASMEPTLRPGQRVLARRVRPDRVRPGQIVVAAEPELDDAMSVRGWDTGRWMIKRAVAVPGDPVPAALTATLGTAAGAPVPAGRLIVFGDNRDATIDSRRFGYVPADRLLGVVIGWSVSRRRAGWRGSEHAGRPSVAPACSRASRRASRGMR